MNKRIAAIANLIFSSAGAAMSLVVGLVMVPIYLRRFDISTYGAWLASGNMIGMLTVFESGLASVATQRLSAAFGQRDEARFAAVGGAAIIAAACIGLFVAVGGSLLAPWIVVLVKTPVAERGPLSVAVILSSVASGGSILFYTIGAIPQAWQRTVVPGVIGTVAIGANVSAILLGLRLGYGVIALGMGPVALSAVYILGYGIYVPFVWRKLRLPALSFSSHEIKTIMRDSGLLLIARIAATTGNTLEISAAAIFVSARSSAVLSLTGKLVTVAEMFIERIGSAVFAGVAHIAESAQREGGSSVLREILVISTVLSGMGVGVAVAFTRPVLSFWVGNELFGGRWLLIAISASALLMFRKRLFSNLTIAAGQIRQVSMLLMLEAALRIVLVVSMAAAFGLMGIPLASALVSLAIAAALSGVFSRIFRSSFREVWFPGARGFVISISIGLLWMLLAPEAKTIVALATQGAIYAVLVLGATALGDREWRSALKVNALGLKKSMKRRVPA